MKPPVATFPETLDLDVIEVRALNRRLQGAAAGSSFRVRTPAARHHLAVGLTAPIEVEIAGHAGYYAGGMNTAATVRVHGSAGVGAGENMMSGRLEVHGSAGSSAAAGARGGMIAIAGDAGARCGISLKGADLVVAGSVGRACGFMAQSGRIVVCGDAALDLGDSIYEARIYVAGAVAGLGIDCVEKPLEERHRQELEELLDRASVVAGLDEFRRFGSARRLYHFDLEAQGR